MKRLGMVMLLTALLTLTLIAVRAWVWDHFDPYWIDYDAPGVDITSEGP